MTVIKETRVRTRGQALMRLLEHLDNADDNEEVVALRGNYADLRDARDDARNYGREYCVRQWIVAPSSNVDFETMLEAVDRLAAEFGFDPAKAVVRGHRKTKAGNASLFDGHVHILVAEVDPLKRGRVLSSSNDWLRGEKIAKILSFEWGENFVASKNPKAILAALTRDGRSDVAAAFRKAFPEGGPRPVAAFDTAAQQRLKRCGFDLPALRVIVAAAWQAAATRDTFETSLSLHELTVCAGDKPGVYMIVTSDGTNVGSLARLTKVTKADVVAKMENTDARPQWDDETYQYTAKDYLVGSQFQEYEAHLRGSEAADTVGSTGAGIASGESHFNAAERAERVTGDERAERRKIGQDHRIAERTGDRESGEGNVEGVTAAADFAFMLGLSAHASRLHDMLATATRGALSQNERVVVELADVEGEARLAKAMVDTPVPESVSLREAHALVAASSEAAEACKPAVTRTAETLAELKQPRPWWRRALGYMTGENARHAATILAAKAASDKAQSALKMANDQKVLAEKRLGLEIKMQQDAAREHTEKWKQLAATADPKIAAVQSAQELLKRLPGASALGPVGVFQLGAKMSGRKRPRRHSPRGSGEPDASYHP